MTSEPTDHERVWRIGRFRVEAVVGTGAFATVYRAVDDRLDDVVAVKVLAENHSLDLEIRKRFLTEGRVLRRIVSPHVVAVHDLGETERQQPFLVLEFASRGTLAERVRELRAGGWRPAPADLWAVAEPLARALDAVHAAGIVHRDVNPANVLLTTRGAGDRARSAAVVRHDERLMLADLGLCKDLALHSGHTSGGGTEGFRAPELRGGPAIIDHRADLWSLSALMTWLATGSAPDVIPVGVGLPAGLGRVLARGLADDPAARHPDALSWLSEVEAGLGQHNLNGGPPPGPTSDPIGPAGAAVARRGRTWRLRQSAWVLASLALGFTTWAGFLYIGVVARQRRWLLASAAYGAAAAACVGLFVISPTNAQGEVNEDSWRFNLGTALMVITWIVGFAHALLANRDWLDWRATSAGPAAR